MSVLTELAKRQNRVVFLLEVDGLENTYYNSPSAPTLPAYTQPWAHTAKGGVVGVTSATQELDVLESVASGGQVSITIAITRTNDASQFMKRGVAGAGLTVTLATTVAQTGATFVEVNEDLTAWGASGVIWLGREAIRYTAKSGGAPWRFTIIDADRGWFGSEQRLHRAATATGFAPRVYDACVTWKYRKARVLVSSLRPDGSVSDGWVEYVTGRIVSNPEVDETGTEIAINIIPNTDALNNEVGGDMLSTGLQHGYHAFDGVTAHRFQFRAGWGEGQAFSHDATFASAGANDWPVIYARHTANFATPGTGASVARSGILKETDQLPVYSVTARTGNPGGQVVGDALTVSPNGAVSKGDRIFNAAAMDTQVASVLTAVGTAEVIQWPDEACERLSATLSPGTMDGAAGSFVDLRIDPTQDVITITRLTGGYPTIEFRPWNADRRALYYGISTFEPSEDAIVAFLEVPEVRGAAPITRSLSLADVPGDAAQSGYAELPIRGVALGYHQRGEKFLHVQDDLFSYPSVLQVSWTDNGGNGDRRLSTVVFAASGQTAASITADTPGHVITIDSSSRYGFDDISFGDWPGLTICTISQIVAWRNEDPGVILLTLLLSGDGAGFASATYDVFPNGASLTTAEVDIDSFLRYPYPDGLGRLMTLSLNDFGTTTIREIAEPILKAIGAAIVIRLVPIAASGDGGVLRRKLSLVPVGSEYSRDSVATVGNGDWVGVSRPAVSNDERIVNTIRLSMNYDTTDDEYDLIVTANDSSSIAEYGNGAAEELEMRGVVMNPADVPDQIAQVVPFAAHRFANLGSPRAQIEGTIAWADAVSMSAGAVVVVTADDAFNYNGTRPVTSQPMRIIRIDGSPSDQTATVKLVWHDATVSGWAPCLQVSAVTSAAIYTVEANQFTEMTDPSSGAILKDIDYWAIGDSIRACPRGDYANSTGGLTVSNIAGNIITLSGNAAPALIVGDTLRPDNYDVVATTTDQKLFVFLASSTSLLDAIDPAKSYG